jgi:hypothetical protein
MHILIMNIYKKYYFLIIFNINLIQHIENFKFIIKVVF